MTDTGDHTAWPSVAAPVVTQLQYSFSATAASALRLESLKSNKKRHGQLKRFEGELPEEEKKK